jgi:hypothetical protein
MELVNWSKAKHHGEAKQAQQVGQEVSYHILIILFLKCQVVLGQEGI